MSQLVESSESPSNLFSRIGWGLVLSAWVYACLVGNGTEVQRLAPIPAIAGLGMILILVSRVECFP